MRFVCCYCLICTFSIISNSANPIRDEICPHFAFVMNLRHAPSYGLPREKFTIHLWVYSKCNMKLWIGCTAAEDNPAFMDLSNRTIFFYIQALSSSSPFSGSVIKILKPSVWPACATWEWWNKQLIAKLRAFWHKHTLAVHTVIKSVFYDCGKHTSRRTYASTSSRRVRLKLQRPEWGGRSRSSCVITRQTDGRPNPTGLPPL